MSRELLGRVRFRWHTRARTHTRKCRTLSFPFYGTLRVSVSGFVFMVDLSTTSPHCPGGREYAEPMGSAENPMIIAAEHRHWRRDLRVESGESEPGQTGFALTLSARSL